MMVQGTSTLLMVQVIDVDSFRDPQPLPLHRYKVLLRFR